jgi:hypothetical protein
LQTFGELMLKITEAVQSLEQCSTHGKPLSLALRPQRWGQSQFQIVVTTSRGGEGPGSVTEQFTLNLDTSGWSSSGDDDITFFLEKHLTWSAPESPLPKNGT